MWGRIFKALAKGIFRSRLALVGAILAGVTMPVLLVFTILDMQGVLSNPYFSFINYAVLGPLSIVGVVLLIIGLFTGKADEDIGLFAYEYLKEQLSKPGRFTRIRKLFILVTSLTLITVFVVGVISYTSFNYTDSTSFCGQFCHSVMEPQYKTYKNSPHSRVACVACHFEQGEWSAGTKLSGIKQIFAVVLNSYPRPIEAPATHLRPTRKSCEQCHLPEKFHGEKLYVKDRFLPDEKNTHLQTVLIMKVGSGGVYRGGKAHGIHWHVAPENKLLYRAVDKKREEISEVRLQRRDGTEVVYAAADGKFAGVGELRVLDCVDCHNRPTHVFLSPNEALDRKLFSGEIPVSLPFIKKIGLEALSKNYSSYEDARVGIDRHLRGWYGDKYPQLLQNKKELIDQASESIFQAYQENVFPDMNVGWSTYESFLGHDKSAGCFRCHDGHHQTADGLTITNDCDACHIVLAEDVPATDFLHLLQGEKSR